MDSHSPRVTFYFRHGCHLCDDMWQQLQEMRKERPFALQAVDVDGSRALVERFGQLVPVLAAGEHILCSYYLDPVALRSFLDRREGAV